jgi:hypothetical protein
MPTLDEARAEFEKTLPTQSFADLIACMAKFTSRMDLMEQQNEILEGARKILKQQIANSTDAVLEDSYRKQLLKLDRKPAYDKESFEHLELSIKMVGDELNRRWARLEMVSI